MDLDISRTLQQALEHHGAGDLAAAVALYEQVLAAAPGHGEALHYLGIAHLQGEQVGSAVERLEQAARALPGNADVHSNLGVALRARGREADAATAFQHALRVNPAHPNAGYNLAIAQRNLGQHEAAITSLRDAIARVPAAAERHCDLAGLLLESGRGAQALDACDACLALAPHDVLAMSYKAAALAQRGDAEGAAYLLAMEDTVAPRRLPLPPGWSSGDALCDALTRYVCDHPTLHAPTARATTHGRQTGELLSGDDPLAAALAHVIDTAVENYLETLPVDPSHPYLATRPRRWNLTAWGVVLDDQGHQAAHAHPTGWVSGVFYVSLPQAVQAGDAGHAGWIEFGRPPDEIPSSVEPPVKVLAPERGLMVLFPSYLYHRTIPFSSGQPRISIAFDAQPLWTG